MNMPNFIEEQKLWSNGYDLVIGVDEVGRGSFAGPVVAAACAFQVCHPERSEGSGGFKIDDSKRLSPQEREKASTWIKENCLVYGIGEVSVATINKVGIGKATMQAMRLAIQNLVLQTKNPSKSYVLVDAFHIKYLRGIGLKQQKPIVKGDQKSISIAAASIIAKVYRDAIMQKLARKHAIYGWGSNKGYGTRDHQEAIIKNGITRLHRIVFVETFLRTKGFSLRGAQPEGVGLARLGRHELTLERFIETMEKA